MAQATTTDTGTNNGFRAGRPACRLPSGNGTAGAGPGSHPRSQGSHSGKRVPGTRPHQPDPVSLGQGVARARIATGIDLAGRPRGLPRELKAPGADRRWPAMRPLGQEAVAERAGRHPASPAAVAAGMRGCTVPLRELDVVCGLCAAGVLGVHRARWSRLPQSQLILRANLSSRAAFGEQMARDCFIAVVRPCQPSWPGRSDMQNARLTRCVLGLQKDSWEM